MILVSFFFSHRALSIGIGRDGIGLKVTEIAQTDTHSAFNVLGYVQVTIQVWKVPFHFYSEEICIWGGGASGSQCAAAGFGMYKYASERHSGLFFDLARTDELGATKKTTETLQQTRKEI
jgi:hypothetical protein